MTDINLLPWREFKREQKKKQFMLLIVGVMLVSAAFVAIVNYYEKIKIDKQSKINQRLSQEISRLNRDIASIQKLKKMRAELLSRMAVVQTLQTHRPLSVHLFNELIKILPEDVYVRKLSRKQDQIELVGYSDSNSNISLLMRHIESNQWLHEPVLTQIKKTTNKDRDKTNAFELTFMLKSKQGLNG